MAEEEEEEITSAFLYIFLIYFAEIYDSLKFCIFDIQPPWPTAVSTLTTVGHGSKDIARAGYRAGLGSLWLGSF
jgi:hypothetical protein